VDESTLFLPNAAPNWQQALNDFNQNGRAFVVAPVENMFQRMNGDAKLLIFKDSSQQLRGVFMMYLPDEAYRIQTNGNYNPATFTGIIVYTDVNGQAFLSCRIQNGQIQNLYDATINGGRTASSRACLDIHIVCGVAASNCGTIRFCDCTSCGVGSSGGGGIGGAGTGSPLITLVGPSYTFSYGNGPTTTTNGSSSGSSNTGGSGGGNTWGGSQPNSTFSDLQLKNALSPSAWEAVKDNLHAKNLVRNYFNKRGASNAEAIENNIDLIDISDAFNDYLTLLTNDDAYFQANKAVNFPLKRYSDAGFTFQEFNELHSNPVGFEQINTFLNINNFDADSKDYIRTILKNLKDAKDISTLTSSFCSKQDLYNYVKNSSTICPDCSEGQLQDKIGTMFENAFNEWQSAYNVGNYEPNTNDAFRRFSVSRNADVAPDGFMKSITHPTLGQLGVDQKAHWVECKASNKSVLGLADYTGQIKGEIETLAEYQPWACANQMAAISYVTTIDMVPSPKLIDYANARGIWILQSYASFEIRSDGKMYLTFASVYPHRTQFGQPFPIPTMAALKQTLTSNYVEFR
jgi:hypothetical protein